LNYFPAGGIMIANCGEQPLESTELCNLVEICLPRCTDYAQFEQVTLCALYYGKLVTMLPVGVPDTDAIMRRNRRIGVSVTGFVECMDRATWFSDAYSTMRKFDQRVSRRHNIAESVKITSVKPSGTVSLVLGCSPGMNPHFAPHYIRRINIEDTSPLCAMLDAAGYPRERNVYSKTSYVYEFPMRASGPTSFTAVEQLQNVLTLQANWSDNMVSNTIVFDESEIDDIADFVFANRDKFKSLAFLKREHGFEQAPLEEITADDYAARVAALRPLDLSILHGADTHDTDERGCESGKCEIVFGGE
jgi:ribonucleoside-diphosphate reductase alpha chain